ncbi:O-acyltransferase like protein-like [Panulirus ornatus]|uniref:O-acyltransferase like protein-like n=1 Tax=Panulirus ornatus TaxID=150431 RepID=UPI003A8591F8
MMVGRDSTWLVSVLFFMCLSGGGGCHEAQDWFQEQGRRLLPRKAANLMNLYLPSHVQQNSKCGEALEAMHNSVSVNQTWALKMVDSWGKSSDGILLGNFMYAGMYDECVRARNPDNSIRGRYCNINIMKIDPNGAETKAENFIRGILPNIDLHLPPISINSPLSAVTNVSMYSTCIPDACDQEDLQESLIEELNGTKYGLSFVYCHPDDSVNVFSAGDIAFITLVSFLFLLILLAGIVDVYIEKTNNKTLAKGALKYLLPFSVYTNTRKLFHLSTTKSRGTISCLHGIRVLSMTWVVYGHQNMPTLIFQANLYGMWSKINDFLFQAIANGYPSVDTFFFIGGVLLSYNLLKQVKRTRRFNPLVFYIHRLIRLIPPIGLLVGMYATVVRFFISGPYAYYWHYWQGGCEKTWWRDILFINNFVNEPISPEIAGDCLGQCWYLAVDTQLYLVAPLIILPLYFYNAAGKVWLYLLNVVAIIIPAAIIYANDLAPSAVFVDPKAVEFFDKVYLAPWCRAGPWLVGIFLGYVFYKQEHQKVILHKWQVVAGWTVAVTTGFLVVYGIWSYNTVPPKAQYDVVTQVVYGGLQRTAWGAAVAWVVYACHNGYGGLVDEFLSHPVWQPISRLTYDIYLVAFPLQFALAYCARSPFYYTHLNKIIETVAGLIISFGIAVLVSLTVEAPIIGLEKILLGRPDSGRGAPPPAAPDGQVKQSGQDNPAFNSEITERIVENGTSSPDSDNVEIVSKM